MLTIRPQQTGANAQTFNLSNIHGDIFATLDATGAVLGTTQTGPFGETLSGQTLPVNGATGVSYSYVGKYLKATETQLTIKPMQMGARVYLPNIGRFTSVDPVQGGTPNPYTYVTDPVNDKDLNGMWGLKLNTKSLFSSIIFWAKPTIIPRGGGGSSGSKGGSGPFDQFIKMGTKSSTPKYETPKILKSGTSEWKNLQPRKLDKSEIKMLKDQNRYPHDIKGPGGGGSNADIWKDKNGELYKGPHQVEKGKEIKLDPMYDNLAGDIMA